MNFHFYVPGMFFLGDAMKACGQPLAVRILVFHFSISTQMENLFICLIR